MNISIPSAKNLGTDYFRDDAYRRIRRCSYSRIAIETRSQLRTELAFSLPDHTYETFLNMHYLTSFISIGSIVLLGAMSPGPNFLAVTKAALTDRMSGILAAAGIALAMFSWSALSAFGLNVILKHLPWAYDVVRLIGATYLIFLGSRMLRSLKAKNSLQNTPTAAPMGSPMLQAFIVGISNPKAAAFFGSFFVAAIPSQMPLKIQLAIPIMVIVIVFSWFSLIAFIFSSKKIKAAYNHMKKSIEMILGMVLIIIGTKLILGFI